MKIETGIPIPPLSQRRVKKYPFKEMAIGDSMFDSDFKKASDSAMCNAAKVFAHRQRAKGKYCKFETAIIDGGVRIWRVA